MAKWPLLTLSRARYHEEMWPKSALAVLTLFLLAGTLTLDILTPAALVVAILFNVPIALSSLLLSRNFTLTVMTLALAGNLLAGFLNAQNPGLSDTTALLNRLFSALSFVLVGFLTLRLRSSTIQATRLSLEQSRAERERTLRQLLTSLSGSTTPEVFLERTAAGLRDYLDARGVVIVAFENRRYAALRCATGRDPGPDRHPGPRSGGRARGGVGASGRRRTQGAHRRSRGQPRRARGRGGRGGLGLRATGVAP